jgi:hypothetical protein
VPATPALVVATLLPLPLPLTSSSHIHHHRKRQDNTNPLNHTPRVSTSFPSALTSTRMPRRITKLTLLSSGLRVSTGPAGAEVEASACGGGAGAGPQPTVPPLILITSVKQGGARGSLSATCERVTQGVLCLVYCVASYV